MLGSLKELKTVDDEVRGVVSQVVEDIKSKLNVTEFEPVSYKTQTVAGTNYFVKGKTSNGFAHARIYKDLSGNVSVHSVQSDNVTETSDITHF